jgi:hypothetical protein
MNVVASGVAAAVTGARAARGPNEELIGEPGSRDRLAPRR